MKFIFIILAAHLTSQAEPPGFLIAQADQAERESRWADAGDLLLKAIEAGAEKKDLGTWQIAYISDPATVLRHRAWRDYSLSKSKEKLEAFLWSVAKSPGQAGSYKRDPVYDQTMAFAQLTTLADTPEKLAAIEKYLKEEAGKNKKDAALWAALTWFYDSQGKLDRKMIQSINPVSGQFAQAWRSRQYQYALQSIYVLSKLETPQAARTLVELLSGASEGREAQGALAGFPDAVLNPAIKAASRNGYYGIRSRAAGILAQSQREGRESIAAAWLLDPNQQTRISALKALKEFGSEMFMNIWPVVKDASPVVRGSAISTLAELSEEENKQFLENKAEAGQPGEQIAAKVILISLGQKQWAGEVARAKLPRQLKESIAVTLSAAPPVELEPLLMSVASSKSREHGWYIQKALAHCPSKKTLTCLAKAAESKDHSTSWRAKNALMNTPRENLNLLIDVALATKSQKAVERISKLVRPGDEAVVKRILPLSSDPKLGSYVIRALAKTGKGEISQSVCGQIREMFQQDADFQTVQQLVKTLGEPYQAALLDDAFMRAVTNDEAAQALQGFTSEAVLASALTHELNTEATRAVIATALGSHRQQFAVPLLLVLMKIGGDQVRENAGKSLRRFAQKVFSSAGEAEQWWKGIQKPEKKQAGISATRKLSFSEDAGLPFGFSPTGSFLLCMAEDYRFRLVSVNAPDKVIALPYTLNRRPAWGYADAEHFWFIDKNKLIVMRDDKVEQILDCPPFISSAAYIRERGELWVSDPRRCSVTIHDLHDGKPPHEIPLAPTVGRGYLRVAWAPGNSHVAASSTYARTGFLINIQTRKVTPAPGMYLPQWRTAHAGLFTPDGKCIWSIDREGLVMQDVKSGRPVRQFYFRDVFKIEPQLPKQSVLAMNAHFNLIAGCTNSSVAVVIRGRYLLLVDSQTGKSMLCEDANPRTPSSVLVRPTTKEVWLTDTGEAKVFRIK